MPSESNLPPLAPPTPASLVTFDTQKLPQEIVEVCVIGSGVAGLSAAVEAATGGKTVLILAKDIVSETNTAYAQGGIAVALGGAGAVQRHIEDTIAVGGGLCDVAMVRAVVESGPACLDELMRRGAEFDPAPEGDGFAITREGGHREPRVLHAGGDATGREVQRALTNAAFNHERIRLYERVFAVELLRDPNGDGRPCVGVLIHSASTGLRVIWAETVILATGGAGAIYRETSNPKIATGDGHAMAYRAGAVMRDLEFMQFHPTVLYIAGSARVLVTEAVRGEGGYLRDKNGNRFMLDYHKDAELAPRDVVSRSIFAHMNQTHEPHMWLDVTHLPADLLQERFPTFFHHCSTFNIDLTNEWVPVLPAAHYFIGGCKTDIDGHTSIPGLLAAGEITSSGLHGANRLASNSLLEGLVLGQRAGAVAAAETRGTPTKVRIVMDGPGRGPGGAIDVTDLRNSLRALLWRHLGVLRRREGLEAGLRRIQSWARYALTGEFDKPVGWVLQNQLILGAAMLESALWREESRGVHYRADFPEPRDHFADHRETQAVREDSGY